MRTYLPDEGDVRDIASESLNATLDTAIAIILNIVINDKPSHIIHQRDEDESHHDTEVSSPHVLVLGWMQGKESQDTRCQSDKVSPVVLSQED